MKNIVSEFLSKDEKVLKSFYNERKLLYYSLYKPINIYLFKEYFVLQFFPNGNDIKEIIFSNKIDLTNNFISIIEHVGRSRKNKKLIATDFSNFQKMILAKDFNDFKINECFEFSHRNV